MKIHDRLYHNGAWMPSTSTTSPEAASAFNPIDPMNEATRLGPFLYGGRRFGRQWFHLFENAESNRRWQQALTILGVLGVWAVQNCLSIARADTFPSKPVRIVVPYPISGPTDIRGTSRMSRSYRLMAPNAPPAVSDALARTVAQSIQVGLQQPVHLERQPGGATTRGTLAVARAAADGHTLLLASNATMVINPHYFHGVEYDPARDFVLVAPLATMPFVLMARSDLAVETPQALVRWLKSRPGEINYGSSSDGSTGHLAGELFRRMAGVHIVHVSFSSGVAALNGLATRQISLMFAALPLTLTYYPSEHFSPLAVASPRRAGRLPGVPTLAESGLPGCEIEGWYGLFAPVATPSVANAWLRERITAAIAEPAIRASMEQIGLEPATMSFESFATRIHTEQAKWGPMLRASRMPLKDGA